mgnify:CR=1 FL=1
MTAIKKESIVELSPLQKSIVEYHDTIAADKKLDNDIQDLSQRLVDIDKEIQSNLETIKTVPDYSSLSIAKIKEYSDSTLRLEHQITALKTARVNAEKQIEEKRSNREFYRLQLADIKEYSWSIVYSSILETIDTNRIDQLIVAGCSCNKSFDVIANDILKRDVEYALFDKLAKQYGIPV